MKSIPGYENYLISENGQVYSLKSKKIRKIQLHNRYSPYKYIRIYDNQHKLRTKKIHTLVAITYIGPRPLGCVINHKDGNKLNNHIDNLEYISNELNLRLARQYKPWFKCQKGSNNYSAKLTEDEVRAIRSSNLPRRQLGLLFGVSLSTISNIVNNKQWRHT